ncbi:MAG: hypothetical protein DRN37_02750 [Thermoplasmata archaeon]|nr:MAG: hypothetical protein DRN37_02750 [Thermoplasmata archaeon]
MPVAWAIANIPSNKSFIPSELKPTADEFMDVLLKLGLEIERDPSGYSSTLLSIIAFHACLTRSKRDGLIRVKMREIRYDIDRMTVALRMIDRNFAKWGNDQVWKVLPGRVKKGSSKKRTLRSHNGTGTSLYEKRTIHYSDGSIYMGRTESQKPCGFGTYITADGNKFVCNWQNGRPHGRGSLILNDGTGFCIEL